MIVSGSLPYKMVLGGELEKFSRRGHLCPVVAQNSPLFDLFDHQFLLSQGLLYTYISNFLSDVRNRTPRSGVKIENVCWKSAVTVVKSARRVVH